MISVAEADRSIESHVPSPVPETVPLSEAPGRVLAERVATDRPYPPFDRATMDGVAIRFADWQRGERRFDVTFTQAAGTKAGTLPDGAACAEILTGAPLPQGADTVVPLEALRISDGMAHVMTGTDVRLRQFVHARGSDSPEGQAMLDAGRRIVPPHMGILASLGQTRVEVFRRPRVAIVSTGSELVDPGSPVLDHQLRRSNDSALSAALAEAGIPPVVRHHSPDDPATLRDSIEDALHRSDVLVVSGGVSAGRFDFVPAVLSGIGVEPVFHRVRQRPGKPLWFGRRGDGKRVFGVPGNPVSALVCFYRYVLPFLLGCEGDVPRPARQVRLDAVPERTNDFTLFIPVRLENHGACQLDYNTSGDFLALARSDGFVQVGPDTTQGSLVPYYPWHGAV